MYKKTRVRYKHGRSHTKYIHTVKGVPQGDPLSTVIFNLVVNPMLRELEKHNICYRIRPSMGQTLMMYADDFACICKSEEELQQAINICKKCIKFGAQGITVHPRPDERHTKFSDLSAICRYFDKFPLMLFYKRRLDY